MTSWWQLKWKENEFKKFKDCLTNLKTIPKEIEKSKTNVKLDIKKDIAIKEFKKLKIEKINELEKLYEKLRLKILKRQIFEKIGSYWRSNRIKKNNKKKDNWDKEIKTGNKIETIDDKVLNDLNM